jgi:hypothetical protein
MAFRLLAANLHAHRTGHGQMVNVGMVNCSMVSLYERPSPYWLRQSQQRAENDFIDGITGVNKATLLRQLKAIGERTAEATVLSRIARTYTDPELEALAHYFSSAPPGLLALAALAHAEQLP